MVELARAPERIAVVQTERLGELVFVSPLVRVLKLAWPKSLLTLVTRQEVVQLGACIPGVDAVLPLGGTWGWTGLVGLRALARSLQSPELVLVPEPTFRGGMLAWLSGAATRVGTDASLNGRFFNVKVPVRPREPLVERWMDFARALGVEGPTELQLAPPTAEREKASQVLGSAPSIGLVLGADWPTKRWPLQLYVELGRRAAEAGLRPVLLGEPEDRPLADAFLAQCEVPALDLVGKGLLPTLSAMALLKGVCGGDAGWVHVARAVGTPTLLLFGPTDPGGHTLEYYAQALRLGLDCQPCGDQAKKACPLKHQNCLKQLEVDRVWGALSSLLSRGGRR